MNLDSFRQYAINAGQVATPAGTYLSQCVSLIQQYLNKVYGIPFTPRGDAKDWATNGNVLSHFDRVGSPQAGDIGISGATASNPYGHIWIYTSPTTILEQNGRVSRRVSTGAAYPNPIAILRRKGTPQQGGNNMIPNADNYYARYSKLINQVRGRDITGKGFSREEFAKNIAGVSDLTAVERISDDAEANEAHEWMKIGYLAKKDNWQGQITTAQKQFADATKVATQLQERLAAADLTTKALSEKVDKLNAKVEELQSPDNIVVTRSGFNGLFDKIRDAIKNIGGK